MLINARAPVSDPIFWQLKARDELREALGMATNTREAKNVILFVGDGMGVSTVTAARIRHGQLAGRPGEETRLHLERFPHVALIKVCGAE